MADHNSPLLNVGIQLDVATAAAGQLHLIAGSHLGTSPVPTDEQVARLPTTAITTEPGDVTVHYGHILHAEPPPTDRTASGRRAIYVTFVPPLTFDGAAASRSRSNLDGRPRGDGAIRRMLGAG